MVCKTEIISTIKYMVLLVIIVVLFSVCYYFIDKRNDSIYVAHDETAVVGVPTNLPEDYGYNSATVEDGYEISLCGSPKIDGKNLSVYVTNNDGNDVWIVAKVYDENDKKIGETGVIKQGEYVRDIVLDEEYSGNITIKIIGYVPETFESKGNIALKTKI